VGRASGHRALFAAPGTLSGLWDSDRARDVRGPEGTLKRHLAGVLRFVRHPITNGVAEGLNSKIMSIKRKAGGFHVTRSVR